MYTPSQTGSERGLKKRLNTYSDITLKILSALEDGHCPWNPGWDSPSRPISLPRRWTGESYQGVNVLILWMAAAKNGFSSSRWFTYRQAQKIGAQVRKGEQSTRVLYFANKTRTTDDGEEVERRILRNFCVFNADQINDLPAEYTEESTCRFGFVKSDQMNRLIKRTGATITERRTAKDAYYMVGADRIVMPHRDSFSPIERFYAVLMHELIHWTGAQGRLARLHRDDTVEDYAFEELVAEIGSCFACASIGLTPDIKNSAKYIGDWAKRLSGDHRLIFKAAGAAQKAADYLISRMQSGKRESSVAPDMNRQSINKPINTVVGTLPLFSPDRLPIRAICSA